MTASGITSDHSVASSVDRTHDLDTDRQVDGGSEDH